MTDERSRADDGPDVTVRTAAPEETEAVAAVLEGALLDCSPATVRAAAARGDCLVAVDRRPVGACVLEPREGGADAHTHAHIHVVAIAVRRRHRRRGIGRALLERAADRGCLTATFRPAMREFYEACGFRIEPVEDPAIEATDERRLRGVRESEA